MQGTLIDFGDDNPFVTTPLQAPAPPVAAAAAQADDGSPTAILKGMFPGFDEEIMQAVLSHCDGNLELAAATLLDLAAEDEEPSPSAGIDEDAEVARAIAESNDAELALALAREEEEQMAQMSGPAPGMGTRPAPEGTRWDGAGRLQIQGGTAARQAAPAAPHAQAARRALDAADALRAKASALAKKIREARGGRGARAVGGGGGSGGPGLVGRLRRRSGEGDNFTPLLSAGGDDSGSMAQAELVLPTPLAGDSSAMSYSPPPDTSTISTTRDASDAAYSSRLARARASTGRGRVDPTAAA